MDFATVRFAVFMTLLLILYYRVPGKMQWGLLLAASCLFYASSGLRYLLFLLTTALTSYGTACLMERNRNREENKAALKRRNRCWMAGCLVLNFAMLFVCKVLLITDDNWLLPLGISFYVFQSTGYVVDVYRETVRAERNLLRYVLFVSYFPQLVMGPVSKASRLMPQLFAVHCYDPKQISFGLQRMLWGYFKKLVIADRVAVAVSALRSPEYTGAAFFALTLFYALQIYSDFTGGMDIVIGLSQTLGIEMSENFHRPFFSKNTAEYWRRWHITLGAWMKDYIFYPISVSKPMRQLSRKARHHLGNFGKRLPVYAATLATWFVTGIWHGLTPNFILWGMLNCLVIVLSEELTPLYRKFHGRFAWKSKKWYAFFEMLRTFLLMNLIRACDLFPNVKTYFCRLASLADVSGIHILWDGTLMNLGLTALDYGILLIGMGLMLAVSIIQEKAGSIRVILWNRQWLRYGIFFGLLTAVLLMGCYGIGYEASNFIYNQF